MWITLEPNADWVVSCGAALLSPHVSGWRELVLPCSSVLDHLSLEAFLFSSVFFLPRF